MLQFVSSSFFECRWDIYKVGKRAVNRENQVYKAVSPTYS